MYDGDSYTESTENQQQAAAIDDYALLSDCRSAALVSRHGSIDWCCIPRYDADPCFGLLLDEGAGYCSIAPDTRAFETTRCYLEDTMVVRTCYETAEGSAYLDDLFVMSENENTPGYSQLLRIVHGVKGEIDLEVKVRPRFAFGEVNPWVRQHAEDVFTAVGGDSGLVINSDMALQASDKYSLKSHVHLEEGDCRHLSLAFALPADLDDGPTHIQDMPALDKALEQTIRWWQRWSGRIDKEIDAPGIRRSAIILKALSYAPTGAIIAAPTTSLPEGLKGTRTWDYRFSWVRDAAYTADALVELGCEEDAGQFRQFIERTAAGSADQLRTLYGIDGGQRHEEIELDHLQGYGGATPVRVGNHASTQLQLDVLGELLELAWAWYHRGYQSSDDYWTFLVDLVNRVCHQWQEPDHGIWEMRCDPGHYVHSKVLCWSALNRGITMAMETGRDAPLASWRQARDQVREAVETRGYDDKRGIFVQTFDNHYLDAALLRLPRVGFIDYKDERMLRTCDAVWEGLDMDGLLRRYNSPDGLPGEEGAFLPCSFWLAECLAYQDRVDDAFQVFDRARKTANDLGLFAEQYDPERERLWSNFPQGLTHLSYINAALALHQRDPDNTPIQAG